MAEVQHDMTIADASRQHLAEFVSSGVPTFTEVQPVQKLHLCIAVSITFGVPALPETPKRAATLRANGIKLGALGLAG